MISTKQNRLTLSRTLLGFFALLVLAACGTSTSETDASEANPDTQETAFSVYVLATNDSTLQATPWTLRRGTDNLIKGQGKALETEVPAVGQRTHVMTLNAAPGDELTLTVTTGDGATFDLGPIDTFDDQGQPLKGEVQRERGVAVVLEPATDLESASVRRIIAYPNIALSGAFEVPPVQTDASGEAFAVLINEFAYVFGRVEGLQGEPFEVESSPANVRRGAAGENGPIAFNLDIAANEQGRGYFVGLERLEEEDVERFEQGELYINIHTTFSESGELRGQISAARLEKREGETVASGLNGPMGLLIDPEGNLWVADSGVGGDEILEVIDLDGEKIRVPFGNTARVIRVAPDGTQNEVVKLPSTVLMEQNYGATRLTLLDDTLFVASGIWMTPGTNPKPKMATVERVAEGETVQVADLWAFENENDPDGSTKRESNPYGLAAYEDDLLVTDAAANTLLRVDPDTGEVSVVAVFEGVPSPVPNERRGGEMLNDPVPTGVTVDDDGMIYVSFLPGWPPLPGSAKVVRVTPEGEVSDYATGLDLLTDLQAAPDGNLYAVQMAEFGEQGPVPDTGRVFRIVDGEATEVLSELPFPTAIAFNDEGDAFVTHNGIGAPGSGEVVRYSGLTIGQMYDNPYSIFESSFIR